MSEFLKKATASILVLVYIGPADPHGNWICKHDEILCFNEISSMWNHLRKVWMQGGGRITGGRTSSALGLPLYYSLWLCMASAHPLP